MSDSNDNLYDVIIDLPMNQKNALLDFETMELDMNNLLNFFVMEQLSLQELVEQFKEYFKKHERFLYSSITPFLIGLNNEKRDFLLQKFIELSHSEEIATLSEKLQVKFLKLYDHVNLVISQNANFNTPRENIAKIVNEETKTISQKINKVSKKAKIDIESSKKELYTQLISIVSIFVAISFVMFGGMSLLNNLFDYSEMKSIPLLEMICGGSLIGIVMITVIYAFIVFVLRLTGKFEKIDYEVDSNKLDTLVKLEEKLEKRDSCMLFKLIKIVINGRNEIKHPYRRVVSIVCGFLAIVCVATGILWFCNIRDIDDVKRINTQCKVIEQDDKNVTMKCPLDMDEINKEK